MRVQFKNSEGKEVTLNLDAADIASVSTHESPNSTRTVNVAVRGVGHVSHQCDPKVADEVYAKLSKGKADDAK